ncbi:quaternary amine ABC transporter ATP-binding protein [Flavimaricola marinus]|uniref:Quaternary amine transport ATP-binding protein n=1 Tax=Flavimaricola marinus TaxID=1819565 RepID=A0A238LD15_9RHOB|nr:betaine/proline/choline family ABC transporter ATP-binding protein [Flavimaricola marinus]SMY07518.1 Glycine betaine transport ATP-binding protein OpuAA [Flavimaricola marinus]
MNSPANSGQPASGSAAERPVKLDCRGVWKLYGPHIDRLLADPSNRPSFEDLQAAGVVGAVRDADVQIRQGEIFVIMGLSGSGKSTLVRCLSRLIEPSAGAIEFDGTDLLSMSEKDLIALRRTKVGMVFQNFALLPHLTVLQNVAFPLDVQGLNRATREARAMEMIRTVGLEGREQYYPRQLSGGQQQRVGIARSLVGEPELWFLDEPFSALDPLIRREMQDEFLRLQNLLHKTIVFITHDFEEAIRLADRIAVMKDGQIVQTATPEELILNPATDYVAEFTKHIPRGKVLRVRSIMAPHDATAAHHGSLAATLTLNEAAQRVAAADAPFAVTDATGQIIGQIDAHLVLRALSEAAP